MLLPSESTFTWEQLTQQFSNSFTEEEAAAARDLYENAITYDDTMDIIIHAINDIKKGVTENWTFFR